MKKAISLFLMVLFVSTCAAAWENKEEPFSRKGMKSVYFELGGNGLAFTLNYEKYLTHNLGLRVGGMIAPLTKLTFFGTVMANVLWSKGPLGVETGLGLMIVAGELTIDESSSNTIGLTGTLGLRFQDKPGGIVLRLGFTPIMARGGIKPWFGASIGYTFK